MKISVLTLFPEMILQTASQSILGRAIAEEHIVLDTYQIRDFAVGKYKKVDDTLCGGGKGMLMMCEPIWQCLKHVQEKNAESPCRKIYLSPKGKVLTQDLVKSLAKEEHVLLLCGHYEGVDQRLIEAGEFEEISIGDFVLTGGELPALVLIDALARMLPEVLSEEATSEESHTRGLLEAKQYTKPAVWEGRKVPEVLLSGHHKKIEEYKFYSALSETFDKRRDLFEKFTLSSKEKEKWGKFYTEEHKKKDLA